jgi:hypothetical protein
MTSHGVLGGVDEGVEWIGAFIECADVSEKVNEFTRS